MGLASKAGDWAFAAFTAGLGVATVYQAVKVYRGRSRCNVQLKIVKRDRSEQAA